VFRLITCHLSYYFVTAVEWDFKRGHTEDPTQANTLVTTRRLVWPQLRPQLTATTWTWFAFNSSRYRYDYFKTELGRYSSTADLLDAFYFLYGLFTTNAAKEPRMFIHRITLYTITITIKPWVQAEWTRQVASASWLCGFSWYKHEVINLWFTHFSHIFQVHITVKTMSFINLG